MEYSQHCNNISLHWVLIDYIDGLAAHYGVCHGSNYATVFHISSRIADWLRTFFVAQ